MNVLDEGSQSVYKKDDVVPNFKLKNTKLRLQYESYN